MPDRFVGLALMKGSGGVPTVVGAGQRRGQESGSLHKLIAWGSRATNLLAIALIFGPGGMVRQGGRWILFRIRMLGHQWFNLPSPSIGALAARYGIPVREFPHVNHPDALAWLAERDADVIVNQAPGILREAFLAIPRLGVLNRHNALLPRNRGLFSTFWAVYHREHRTGVSVHFVVKELDAGPILLQHEFPIRDADTVEDVARRCYALAPLLMIESLRQLEAGSVQLIPNPREQGTYNSNPTLRQAWGYRCYRILRHFTPGRD
jgi:methionyl-tRNA formyltransferase